MKWRVILASFYRQEVEKQVTKLPMSGDSGKVVVKRGKGRKRREEGRKGNMIIT